MMRRLPLILLLAARAALAQDQDESALLLADQAPAHVEKSRDWQVFAEGAVGGARLRNGALADNQRLSVDILLDKTFAPGWRAVLSDRLDMFWQNEPVRQNGVNTLKEAYVSWQRKEDEVFDAGRINVRNGVATGYNPTDWFRAGAVRAVVSADPGSLKKNRLGSVMLRGQTLWNGGSLSALYAPKLASEPNGAALNPDLGATNNRNRWMLAVSQRLTDSVAPQWLLFGEQHQSPQLGLNLTMLVNNATVGYVEWAGGRSRSLLSQAINRGDDSAFRNRLATGLSYTTEHKITLTMEYQYNGAGLHDADWEALPRTSPIAYGQYRRLLQNLQESPTRQSAFFYGTWQDAMINHLDLTAMMRVNLADRSQLSWLEGRYHWDRSEVALQWQVNGGDTTSEFGAASQRRIVQALYRYFF